MIQHGRILYLIISLSMFIVCKSLPCICHLYLIFLYKIYLLYCLHWSTCLCVILKRKKKHYATKKGSERENIGINQLNRQIEPRKGVGCDAWLNISVEKLKKYFSHLGQLDLASKKYLMKREKQGRKYTTCIPNIQGKLLWSEGQSLPSESLRLKKLNRWRNNFWFWKKTSQSPKTFCHPHEPSMKYLIGSEDLSKPTEFSEQTLLPAFRGFLDYCIMTWREIGK